MDGEFSFQNITQNVHVLVSRLRGKIRQVLEGTRACEVFDVCCETVEESVFLKFLIILIVVNSILPALAFMSFAVLTLITLFTGFLLLEGVLLILGACAAVLWFGLIGVLFILAAISIMLFYLLYKHVGIVAHKVEQFYSSHISENVDDDIVVVENDHED